MRLGKRFQFGNLVINQRLRLNSYLIGIIIVMNN